MAASTEGKKLAGRRLLSLLSSSSQRDTRSALAFILANASCVGGSKRMPVTAGPLRASCSRTIVSTIVSRDQSSDLRQAEV
ncbi:hypothetical protein G6F35_018788 [Rhizopus arrhizus]|uniref:Uncharacterized protein n=1 Tax=Rhizopus delemar TaxID=936053 RepID=A0A9P6XUY8_9FUNG|nr:hypothetical protein G6F35_018788 [Rhizopus arrhizus]KAG1220756.1 hypothetical protein G6F68_021110 [Rhizopus microsporus]KAG1533127.1 hypothetical protein G6F50_015973 [Rhizopus delemar]